MICQEANASVPHLLVRHGNSRLAEHRYILDVLIGEHLGLEYKFEEVAGLEWVEIYCPQAGGRRALLLGANLLLRAASEWLTPAAMPVLPLAPFDPSALLPDWKLGSLPIMYPPIRLPADSYRRDYGLCLPLDVLGGAFFLLTRYEELVKKQRDKHQRFLAADSVAYQAGFILDPLVDEYALLLGLSLEACFPGLRCRRHQPLIRLSHDVDHPFQFFGQPLGRMFLSAGKRLYHRPRPRTAWGLLQAGVRAGLGRDVSADPFNRYADLMAASEALGTPAEFYFMTGVTNQRYDEPYDLSQPELQEVLRQIHTRGHVIGLHGSYESFRSENALGQELNALRRGAEHAGIGLDSVGGRQHYLRWEHPATWRCANNVGLDYDATLGFPDHIGFRCGTSHEFPVFDPIESRKLRLHERPLIAMDVTMAEYMNLSPGEIITTLENLWAVIKQVGGTMEVLIHNCSPLAIWLAKSLVELKSVPVTVTG